jgi:glyoxylase-like metal-dependent hydrolase (beta-lactamase superfamily II)
MNHKVFASHADLEEKQVSFVELGPGAFAYTAEGDPNSGIVVTDQGVFVIDTQATPVMAEDVIARIRGVTDIPVRYVVLSHYHAVRVLGASAYRAEFTLASQGTYDLIVERGEADMRSEIGRFPRLFRAVDSIPGLTWPNVVFENRLVLHLTYQGRPRTVEIAHVGRGHTQGDTIVWLKEERILYSGDLVEYAATPYTGDAYLREWPATLDRLEAMQPQALVPGRGAALVTPADCKAGLDGTREFIRAMYGSVAAAAKSGRPLNTIYRETYDLLKPKFGHWVIFDHCLPFDVSRAYDEATRYPDPRIWTAERDQEMWQSLEG